MWNAGYLARAIADRLGVSRTTVGTDLRVLGAAGVVRNSYRRYPKGMDRRRLLRFRRRLAAGASDAELAAEFGLGRKRAVRCRRLVERTFLR